MEYFELPQLTVNKQANIDAINQLQKALAINPNLAKPASERVINANWRSQFMS